MWEKIEKKWCPCCPECKMIENDWYQSLISDQFKKKSWQTILIRQFIENQKRRHWIISQIDSFELNKL